MEFFNHLSELLLPNAAVSIRPAIGNFGLEDFPIAVAPTEIIAPETPTPLLTQQKKSLRPAHSLIQKAPSFTQKTAHVNENPAPILSKVQLPTSQTDHKIEPQFLTPLNKIAEIKQDHHQQGDEDKSPSNITIRHTPMKHSVTSVKADHSNTSLSSLEKNLETAQYPKPVTKTKEHCYQTTHAAEITDHDTISTPPLSTTKLDAHQNPIPKKTAFPRLEPLTVIAKTVLANTEPTKTSVQPRAAISPAPQKELLQPTTRPFKITTPTETSPNLPTIQITIGRLKIQSPPISKTQPKSIPVKTVNLSLADYLNRRSGER